MMLQTLKPILIPLMSLCFLGIVCWLLIRNQQGSSRTLNLSGRLLSPRFSALLIILNLIGNKKTNNTVCSEPFTLLRTIGTTLVVLIILLGISNLLFKLKRRQNHLLLVQLGLVAALLVTIFFLVSYFGGCL